MNARGAMSPSPRAHILKSLPALPSSTVGRGQLPSKDEHEPRQVGLADPNPDEDVDGSGKHGHRRGPKRKARSMGRPLKDPFGAAAAKYLAKIAPFRSEYTVKELRRKLRYIGSMIRELRENGAIPSIEPRNLDRDAIGQLLMWMRRKDFSPEYQAKILIVPDLRPVVMDFIAERSKMLERMELPDVEWLIPDSLGRPYSCDRWNAIRYKVFREAGIQGDFRILRPSFAMKLKELGMVLDDRSRLLRHTSTEPTAKFYSNMESLEPWARVEERLAKNRLIS